MIELTGYVRYSVRDLRGKLKVQGEGRNLVVTAGKNLAAAVLASNSGSSPATTQFIRGLGYGDSSLALDEAQTALQGTEHFNPRHALAKFTNGNVIQYAGVFVNSGAAVQVREWGLFTTLVPPGTMVARFLPNEFTFANNDSLNFSWSLEVG